MLYTYSDRRSSFYQYIHFPFVHSQKTVFFIYRSTLLNLKFVPAGGKHEKLYSLCHPRLSIRRLRFT